MTNRHPGEEGAECMKGHLQEPRMRQLQMETDSEQVALTLGHAIVQPTRYSIHLRTKLLHAKWQNIQCCGVVTSAPYNHFLDIRRYQPYCTYIRMYIHIHVYVQAYNYLGIPW